MDGRPRILIVGGGYGGMHTALRLERLLRPGEATAKIADPRSYMTHQPLLAEAAAGNLEPRHVEVRLRTRLTSAEGGRIRLDDGEEFPAGTVVWTAGIAPSPLARNAGLPVDAAGRIIVSEILAVKGTDGVWALGDCATVPDLAAGGGALCAPTAQHAYRQARRLAGNITAALRGGTPRPYRHASAGSVASLGLYRGAAEVYGLRMRGFPAWATHRTYHLL